MKSAGPNEEEGSEHGVPGLMFVRVFHVYFFVLFLGFGMLIYQFPLTKLFNACVSEVW